MTDKLNMLRFKKSEFEEISDVEKERVLGKLQILEVMAEMIQNFRETYTRLLVVNDVEPEANMMDKVADEVLEEKPTMVIEPAEEQILAEPDNLPEKAQEELFEKPKAEPSIEISKKTGKPKRKLTEKQLLGLAKAREKSKARRMELKEAKQIDKEKKKIQREIKNEEKYAKKEEQESLIRLKAQMKLDVEKSTTWDEERLSSLMMKTIDTYMEKKKAFQPQGQYTTQPQYKPIPRMRKKEVTPLNTLFGNFTQNN